MNFARYKTEQAFTMAELLIVLGMVGVLAAITLPTLKNNLPDRNDAIRKKVEYELEQKVAELYSDDVVYGDRYDENGNLTRGFRNTYYVKVGGVPYGDDSDDNFKKQKFCKLLASRFDLSSGPNCDVNNTAKFTTDGGTPTFITRDGIEWLLEVTDFVDEKDDDSPAILAFKVSSGNNRGNNCARKPENQGTQGVDGQINTFVGANKAGINYSVECNRPDIFLYAVNANGTLYKPYARSAKVITRH